MEALVFIIFAILKITFRYLSGNSCLCLNFGFFIFLEFACSGLQATPLMFTLDTGIMYDNIAAVSD
jgi:hypothetical protein